MANKFKIRKFSLLLLVSITLISLLLLTSCSVSRDEELYEIPLTEEQLTELDKMKSPGFISSDEEEFLEYFSKLDTKDQEYIIQTVGEENLIDFGVYSPLINEHLFEPQYIDVLLEFADIYAQDLEINDMTYEEFNEIMEPYLITEVPNFNSHKMSRAEYLKIIDTFCTLGLES